MDKWTDPHCGVQHLGQFPTWVTVTDRGDWAELLCYYHGCNGNPIYSLHLSAAEARNAGEKWMSSQLHQRLKDAGFKRSIKAWRIPPEE